MERLQYWLRLESSPSICPEIHFSFWKLVHWRLLKGYKRLRATIATLVPECFVIRPGKPSVPREKHSLFLQHSVFDSSLLAYADREGTSIRYSEWWTSSGYGELENHHNGSCIQKPPCIMKAYSGDTKQPWCNSSALPLITNALSTISKKKPTNISKNARCHHSLIFLALAGVQVCRSCRSTESWLRFNSLRRICFPLKVRPERTITTQLEKRANNTREKCIVAVQNFS